MKRCMEIADLYNIKMLSEICADTKDGKYAVVETEIRKKQQDYYSTISVFENKNKLVQICMGEISKTPVFSADGENLFFLSNKSGTMQLWLYNLAKKESRQLTTHRFGIQEYILSPDGKKGFAVAETGLTLDDTQKLYMEKTAEEKEREEEEKKNHAIHITDIVHKWDGIGYLTGRKTHIFEVDMQTGKMQLLTEGGHNFRSIGISQSGDKLVFISDPPVNADLRPIHNALWLYDRKKCRQILLSEGMLQIEDPCFINQDTEILFRGMDGKFGWETINRLWSYDLKKKEMICHTSDSEFDFAATDLSDMRMASSSKFQYDDKKDMVYFTASWQGNTGLYRWSKHTQLQKVLETEGVVQSFSLTEGCEEIYCVISRPAYPGKVFHYSLEKELLEKQYDPNAEFFKNVAVSIPESIQIKSFDGICVQGWIQKPYDFEPGRKYKTVLEIHGGPGCMYAKQFMHEFQVLNSHGYIVIFFNPRGSTGYGQKFQSLIQRRYGGNGGGDYEDLMAAVDQVAELPYIDEEQLYVTGGSYGGFMTNWIVGHTDRFRAAVSQRSISNWSSFIGSSDYGFCEAELGHQCDYMEEQFELRRISPVSYARNVCTPLMLLHSDKDYRCPLEQAEQFFTILKLLGKTVEMKIFPGQSHGLSRCGRPALREERIQTILDWFEKYGGQTNG